MIKRTIAIDNPSRLSVKNSQLIIEQNGEVAGKVPTEDIGILIIDHPAVLYTHVSITALLENNTAVVLCGENHHPKGLLLPLDTNSVQSERFRCQIESGSPLKKRLWKQTVQAKIRNQANLLTNRGVETARLSILANKVKSGDPQNIEAQASRFYWPRIFDKNFRRERTGPPPNNFLNYGYMILRAAVARSLVSSGLLPTLGIHHRNRYNAYCLADDVMEPFRPIVDLTVLKVLEEFGEIEELTSNVKKVLLGVLTHTVSYKDQARPLMVGLHQTTASLYRCFSGEQKSIDYPVL
ncbi:MAG TPA: type II CRISPR-associated endonuclease Cas1 [Nitrospina sp.]|nr:type II CRISPR-associated endonuclease Cas1 [Nitrospina sp.]|tara:strand:+ start:3479 stop:4363 length:885 start_codon:yes stop_codon:yes gene_type:complete